MFSRNLFLSSPFMDSVPGVSTKSAVKVPRNALAILAAVRIILALEGEEDRHTRICSPV